MNKKALTNISIIFFSLIFLILWALFFAEQVATWGHAAAVAGEMVGIEALLYNNINLIIAVIFFIFILAMGLGGGQG